MRPRYLVVAHISRAQGLNGAVDVISLTDFPERFAPGVSLLSSPPLAKIDSLTIESAARHPKSIVLKFAEINSREEAERILGHDLMVPIDAAVDLPDNEFWIHDIVGMEVYTLSGERVGHVTEILRTGSNDVYVVNAGDIHTEHPDHDKSADEEQSEYKVARRSKQGGEKEYLIPAIKDVVKSISVEDRKIIIDPIPGLLE